MKVGSIVFYKGGQDKAGEEILEVRSLPQLTNNKEYKVMGLTTGYFKEGPKPAVFLDTHPFPVAFSQEMFNESQTT